MKLLDELKARGLIAQMTDEEQIKDLMDAEREAEMKKDIAIQKAVDFVVSKAKEK